VTQPKGYTKVYTDWSVYTLSINKLSALKVKNLTTPGMHGDGGGLYLHVRSPTQRAWVFRFKRDGREYRMGLGSVIDVSLREARDAAAEARKLTRQGINPIEAKKSQRLAAEAERGAHTFEQVARLYIKDNEAAWGNALHRSQWSTSLEAHVFPAIGTLPVAAITVTEVLKVLQPIWLEISETASRIRGRIETILDYAKARGWRKGENPAQWKGYLSSILPKPSKIKAVQHHPALPWKDMAPFMASVKEEAGTPALALRFLILTAARLGEVLGATWSEIDLDERVWTIPASRMKAKREHRVPLSPPAVALLQEMAQAGTDAGAFIFGGRRQGRPLSNMAIQEVLRRMDRGDITAHGFRSSFRDWAAEATDYPAEVAEMALAHTVGSKVEAAYRRGDMFDKRRAIMEDWAKHCGA
jgi:integrase